MLHHRAQLGSFSHRERVLCSESQLLDWPRQIGSTWLSPYSLTCAGSTGQAQEGGMGVSQDRPCAPSLLASHSTGSPGTTWSPRDARRCPLCQVPFGTCAQASWGRGCPSAARAGALRPFPLYLWKPQIMTPGTGLLTRAFSSPRAGPWVGLYSPSSYA